MKTIRILAILTVAFAFFTGCGEMITDPADSMGSVEVSILLNKVGYLSKVTEINLSDLYIEMSSGTSIVRDTAAVSGSSQIIVDRTYSNLTPGEWTLTAATLDDQDSTIHEGSTTFTVIADQTTEVSLDLTSKYSMLTANFVGIADSVSRLELLVDANMVADTSFTPGSVAGSTVSLEYDYLVTGESHTIQLDAYGSMYGTEQLLYTGDITITVIAGVDTSYTVTLVYVGPTAGSSVTVTITIGEAGRVTVNGEFSLEYGTMTDIDGNVYQTVRIGNQWWTTENLKVMHYRNGDAIPSVTDDTEWLNLTTGAYCEYDNNSANVDTYGLLYNWYAVNDSRNIAPEGWHVPTDDEWKQLEMFLGMSQSEADDVGWRGTDEGNKLKSTSGWYSGGNGSDDYGFAALPGGYRGHYGYFSYMGYGAHFWSATESSSRYAWYRGLNYVNAFIYRNYSYKHYGFSLRLLRD